ncbi:ComF family protein [Psychromonas aquimarina]|uniref:ComF family protein n=1 Tax=Psychromonas aquimarina TaxID=444919 RepID=UPI000407DEF2|nr:double zinc ribbon domain-containing protein [Psychromonas aquimarina]
MNSVLNFIKQKSGKFIEQLLPAQCLLCHLSSNDKLICTYCQNALDIKRPCCRKCGLRLVKTQDFCGDCLQQTHLFTQLHALADYQSPYSSLIKKLKYKKQLISGELLGELLTSSISSNVDLQTIADVDYLLAIPLHRKKHKKRGFNQAEIIAQVTSRQLGIPQLFDAVERHKNTSVQEGLSLKKRKQNLNNAFSLKQKQRDKLAGTHLVIIDDVVTTGATVNSLCRILLQAGVRRIDIWCICRTALPVQKLTADKQASI